VIHEVKPNDTLDRISIMYDISKDAIRRANDFTGDEIYMKKELIIPNKSKLIFSSINFIIDGPVNLPSSEYTEEQRKKE
jgi:LysM repeat protein